MGHKKVKEEKEQKMANIGQIWPEVVIPFAYVYDIKMTASEISRKTRVPRRTAARVLDQLVKVNLIRYAVEGKNKMYCLDLRDQRAKFMISLIESYKSLKFSMEKKKIFVMIEDIMKKRGIVLFGSYARGNATPESDIDILVIGSRSGKVEEIARKQLKQINLHFSTLDGFESLLKKKNVLAMEIMKNHIIFGSPQFAELCWRFYRNEL